KLGVVASRFFQSIRQDRRSVERSFLVNRGCQGSNHSWFLHGTEVQRHQFFTCNGNDQAYPYKFLPGSVTSRLIRPPPRFCASPEGSTVNFMRHRRVVLGLLALALASSFGFVMLRRHVFSARQTNYSVTADTAAAHPYPKPFKVL